MPKFDPKCADCILVMYPAGGYGNFLYYLLSEYLESTVKPPDRFWKFENGHSHNYPKYTEIFALGPATYQGTLKTFNYGYEILDDCVAEQIAQGKQFLVLADVGNKGDNINFLRRYFPRAKIVRVFAETFVEKLILWTNCVTKSNDALRNQLYPGSILTTDGIAAWANKHRDNVVDADAVNCMVDFFQSDFGIYGKMFCSAIPGVINVPIKNFFSPHHVTQLVENLASELGTTIINLEKLQNIVQEFNRQQLPLSLLAPGDTFALVRTAMAKYEN